MSPKPRFGEKYTNDNKSVTLTFKNMKDILSFCLNNAVSRCEGKLVIQTNGIPQGDNLSPAMAIGTCAFFERIWIK